MSIKKNFAFNAVLSVSQILFPIITFPYVTRVLKPEGLGSINFIDSIVQYLIIFSALGIPIYGVREIAKIKDNKQKLSKTFSELIIIHSTLAIFCSTLFLFLLQFVPKLFVEYELCIIGVLIILSNVFLLNWFFAGLEKFVFISVVSLLIRLLTISCIFLFVKSQADKTLYYSFNLVGNVITGIISIIFAKKYINFSFQLNNIKVHFKALFFLFSLSVITSVYVLLDSVILGFLKNNSEVGYYTTAMKISKIPIAFLTALTTVLLPKLSSIDFGDEFKRLVNKAMRFSFIISIPISLGLFVLSKEIILIFAGTLYLPALSSFRILCFIIIPIGFALINYQVLLPYNREKYMMFAALIGVCVSLLLNFILVPYLGNQGSAISSLSTEVVVAIILFLLSYKLCKIEIPYRLIIESILSCSIMFLIKYFIAYFSDNNLIVIFCTGLLGSLVYFALMGYVFKNEIVNEAFINFKNKIFQKRI